MDLFFNLSFTERFALYALVKTNGYKIKSGKIEQAKKFKSQTINSALNNKAFDRLTQNEIYINELFDNYFKGTSISSNTDIVFKALMQNPNRQNEINEIFIKQAERNPKIVRYIFQNKGDFSNNENLKNALLKSYDKGLKEKIKSNSLTKQDVEIITSVKDEKEVNEITVTLAGIAAGELKGVLGNNPNIEELYKISKDNYTKQSRALVEQNLKEQSWFKIIPENMKSEILSAASGEYEAKLAAKDVEIKRLKEQQTNHINQNAPQKTEAVNTKAQTSKSLEEQKIEEKNAELDSREQIADMLEAQQEREQKLLDREEKIQQMEQALQERSRQLEQREQELKAREQDILAREQALSQNENSNQITAPMSQSTQELLNEATQITQALQAPITELTEDSLTDKYYEAEKAINENTNLTPEQKEAERQKLYAEFDKDYNALETTTGLHR